MIRSISSHGEATLSYELPVKRVARGSLSGQVVRAIEELVNRGILKEGDRLPTETLLATQFGVGRSTVREAMRGLALMGVVDVRVGNGTYVRTGANEVLSTTRSLHDVLMRGNALKILQARQIVEIGALDAVVVNATLGDIREIEQALTGLKAAGGNFHQIIHCDLEFHSAIIRATKNEILVEMYRILRKYLQETTMEISQIPGVLDRSKHLHEALVEAIKRRDLAKARKVMKSLLQTLERLVSTHFALTSSNSE